MVKGKPVSERSTLADGLGGGRGQAGCYFCHNPVTGILGINFRNKIADPSKFLQYRHIVQINKLYIVQTVFSGIKTTVWRA
jgi:hypothetical protein